MKNVRIVTGIYGYRPEGAKFITPVRAGDVVEVSDQEADRLVSINVAVYAGEDATERSAVPAAPPSEGAFDGMAGVDTLAVEEGAEAEERNLPYYSVSMKVDQLRALLAQFGIPCRVGMSKADMVAALDALFSADGAPPDLGAEGPVV